MTIFASLISKPFLLLVFDMFSVLDMFVRFFMFFHKGHMLMICVRLMNLYLQVSLLEENIKPRTDLPPLLVHLRGRRPEKLHYIGVSFGLTLDLFRFWKKHQFAPFYICQIPVKMNFPLLVSFPYVRLYIHHNLPLDWRINWESDIFHLLTGTE